MTLDDRGVLIPCASCGTTNRLRYEALARRSRCGKCRREFDPPSTPIDVHGPDTFHAAITKSEVPVIVDFWAPWCGPCRTMAPEVQKLARNLVGRALVLKVDTDANPDLGERHRVRSIPLIAIFQDGEEATRTAGAQPASTIEALLGQLKRV